MDWLSIQTWGYGMKHLIDRRSIGVSLAVFAVGLLASGCDWTGFGFGSQHNGDNANDTTITPANVSTLSAHFNASDGTTGAETPEAVVNGILYVSNAAGGLEAYNATGTTGCAGSPTTCAPLWSYATGPFSGKIMVSNGAVFASTASGLEAFDAAGQTNCSGAPTVCQPLWSASGAFDTPTVSNSTVYVTASGSLEAFDATGTTNCSGAPKVCSPIWTAANAYGTVTVSASIAYALSSVVGTHGGGIVAFDANGSKGCSGSPKVCSPLWEYATNYPVTGDYAVVSGSGLYVDTFYSPAPRQFTGDVEAFDANGVNGCSGTPTVCGPLWSNPTFTFNIAPLAGDSAEFISGPGSIATIALDQNGSGGGYKFKISGTTAAAIGGSVLYGTNGADVQAYDAGGSSGCSGSPVSCTPLWSAPGTDAIVANGTLYVSTTNASGNGEIVAYGLPG